MSDQINDALVGPLVAALRGACGYETVSHQVTPDRIQLVGRQPKLSRWILYEIIKEWTLAHGRANPTPAWTFDFSIQLFLPQGGQKVHHAYRLIIMTRGADTTALVHALAVTATQAADRAERRDDQEGRPVVAQLESFTLGPAATPGRHSNSNGRGAAPNMRAVPKALQPRQQQS